MTQDYNQIYKDLLNRIVESQKDLFGNLAVTFARRVTGLEVSEKGAVLQILNPLENIINNLIYEYKALGGHLSHDMIVSIVEAYRKQYSDIKFPFIKG